MLIRRKIIALTVSLIMTASLFMTQILAAEADSVSGNEAEETEASEEEGSGDDAPAEEPKEEAPDENSGSGEVVQEEAPVEDAMIPIDIEENNTAAGREKTVSADNTERENEEEKNREQEQETEQEQEITEDAEEAEETDADEGQERKKHSDKDTDSDRELNDSETEEQEEAATEEAEKSEKEWLEERCVTENEDGSLEYTDENGDTWEFAPEDPEMFKRIEYDRQTVIPLKHKGDSDSDESGEPQDPYQLILNPDFSYRYPEYYKASGDDALPDVRCGMDISRYQGVISADNWKRLKDEYGIEFVFIRAGYRGYGGRGSLNEDECCTANIENAYEAGVAVGIYYFSQAISVREAEAEADHCLDIIAGHRDMITLPVVTDYEYSDDPGRLSGAGLSDSEHTAIVNAFCDRVESDGYLSGIYANKSMLQSDMVLDDIPDNHLIWMANFVCDSGTGTYSTSYGGPLSAWQFSSRFTGFGEAGNGLHLMKSVYLDLDLWYGDFPGEVREVQEDTSDDEEGAVVVDVDTGEVEIYAEPEITEQAEAADQPEDSGIVFDAMSISNTVMTAEDVVYSPRPRSCRSVIRICDSDGSRLAAGFDYERELIYTYDEDTVVKRRTDMWARKYEEVSVSAGDPVDMKRDVIPVGSVIRVTATGKGRYEDPENNTVSTTFRIIPEKEDKEEPVEVEAVTEESASGKHERLLARLKSGE